MKPDLSKFDLEKAQEFINKTDQGIGQGRAVTPEEPQTLSTFLKPVDLPEVVEMCTINMRIPLELRQRIKHISIERRMSMNDMVAAVLSKVFVPSSE